MLSRKQLLDGINTRFAATFAKHGVSGLDLADPEWAANEELWIDSLGNVDDEQLRKACDFAAGEKAARLMATKTSSVDLYNMEHARLFGAKAPRDEDGNVVSLDDTLVKKHADVRDVSNSAELYEMSMEQSDPGPEDDE